ncbi:MAG: VPLPA-CTERM sorting domain-containing protein [Pseudomonadota bacterium]
MTKTKRAVVSFAALLGLSAMSAGAQAAIYNYTSTVTLCTATCDSFASLDVGTTITGQIEIDVDPNGSFTDADVGAFTFQVFNPALPVSGPVGDPVNDNPLILDSGLGIAGSNGSMGTADAAGQLNGGELLIEFLVPPFSSNGAFVVFDLTTGNGQVCLFFSTAGCIPGATEAVKFEGSFELAAVPVPAAVWLMGSALLGFAGFGRRSA